MTPDPKSDAASGSKPKLKTDPVTGEEFECSGGEGHCWCDDYPRVVEVQGDECMGPTRLKKLVEKRTGSRPGNRPK